MSEQQHSNRGDVARLLSPKSVAILGASATAGALGNSVLKNLERLGFQGDIYLINPKRDEIQGRPCLKSPAELPDGVDVAVLAIPQAFVLDGIKALAEKKVGAAIIFSAGFAEAGEAGMSQQREIGEIAERAGMVVIGPNCLGLMNYVDQIALTFIEMPTPKLEGRRGIGIVSQSGAMAGVLASNIIDRDLGISYSISTGNEAASGVQHYLDFLIEDENTSVIAMIVEQFRDPQQFLKLAEKARVAGKPIVLLHPGRSDAAAQSAATHTGAMAGDYKVMKTKVERAGVVLVETLEALGDVAEIAQRSRRLPSGGCAVLTESGAFKAMTMDLCEDIGLDLPVLTDENAPQLRAAMPEFVAVSNPVDMTAQALVDPGMYNRTLTALAGDDRFGTIVLAIIQTDDSTTEKKFPFIIDALRELNTQKPVIFAGIDEGGIVKAEYIKGLREQGATYFPSTERAMRAIANLTDAVGRSFRHTDQPALALADLPRGVVPEFQSKHLLAKAGIPFPESKMAVSPDEAVVVAEMLGFPVVMKAQSSELSHKSDAGGVAVGLKSADEVHAAWEKMQASVSAYKPGIKLDGILVEAMGKPGVELIVGARNEPGWGPVILVGFGGVTAEIYQDVRLIAPDLTAADIHEELLKLKGARLLTGFRGRAPADLRAVADLIVRLGQVMRGEPSIREVDLNPVVVLAEGEGAVALDALMLVEK